LKRHGGERGDGQIGRGPDRLLIHFLGRDQQEHVAVPALQFLSDGEPGEQMTAGAATGDGDQRHLRGGMHQVVRVRGPTEKGLSSSREVVTSGVCTARRATLRIKPAEASNMTRLEPP